jgi:hypothetical protein
VEQWGSPMMATSTHSLSQHSIPVGLGYRDASWEQAVCSRDLDCMAPVASDVVAYSERARVDEAGRIQTGA